MPGELGCCDDKVVNEILRNGRYTTISLSDGNDSYILTLFYGYDPESRTLYFKSSKRGTKFDFLKSNSYVSGTVIQNPGLETPSYRSVVYRGLVEVIHSQLEKEKALTLIRNQCSKNESGHEVRESTSVNDIILIMKLQIDEMTARELAEA